MTTPGPEDTGAPGGREMLVVAVADLDSALAHFTSTLGFRIDRISPADDPREADLSLGETSVQLRRDTGAPGSTLRLTAAELQRARCEEVAGVSVRHASGPRPIEIPPVEQSLVISRLADSVAFGAGRAGMGYRDLVPNRQGGRFIASHIRIDSGGEVPDYAHYHRIRFQMIYCRRGWVRVVYEDQGDPFVLREGDCVLQPPEIRHRVLESSAGLEVIEIGCPAEHDTFADHDIVLPTGRHLAGRDFGGQRFVHHVAEEATWTPWRVEGFQCRHMGIAEATDGLAGARVVRAAADEASSAPERHGCEFLFFFVLEGDANFTVEATTHDLTAGDSIVIPAGDGYAIRLVGGAELLEVSLPADVITVPAPT